MQVPRCALGANMLNKQDINKMVGMISTLLHNNKFEFVDHILTNTDIKKIPQPAMVELFVSTKKFAKNLQKRQDFISLCEQELQKRQEKISKAFESNK